LTCGEYLDGEYVDRWQELADILSRKAVPPMFHS